MTPVSVIAIPTHANITAKDHKWYCCFNCKCFRRVSQSPPSPHQSQQVTAIYAQAAEIQCPKGPKINAIKASMEIPELPTRDRLAGLFEPRSSSEIDVWFYPSFSELDSE